jgi:regulatory protein
MSKLRQMKLVDDAAFAEYWREKRETHSPRSRRLVGAELRQKGIDRELVANVTSIIDDAESAYRAAHKKAGALAGEDYTIFRRKLSAFLYRKGFSYEVAAHTVFRLWQEFS